MCLAAPPTNRTKPYVLPYGYEQPSSLAAEGSTSLPPLPPGRSQRNSPPRSQKLDGISGGHHLGASPSPEILTSTPPPLDLTVSFFCGLGPTGFSPVGNYSRPEVAASFSNNVRSDAVVPPAVPAAPSVVEATIPASRQAAAPPTKQRRRRGPQRPGRTATDKERLFVQHNYHDLSSEPDDVPPAAGDVSKTINKTDGTTAPKINAVEPFPIKLHRILEESAEDPRQNGIISWQPHGRAFKIVQPKLFTSEVMPRYFPKMKKLTSLQRQLNLYGFERLTREGPDAGAYYHEAFLRGRVGLSASRMVRRRVKGTGYKAASNPEGEPNLYKYPFVGEAGRNNGEEEDRHGWLAAPAVKSNEDIGSAGFPSCSYNVAVPVKPNESTSAAVFPRCYHSDGVINDQDTEAGVVTNSAKISRSPSDYTSSEGSTPRPEEDMKQWAAAVVASPVPIDFALKGVHSINASNMDTRSNHQVQHHDFVMASPSMDDFLSLPEVAQDSFLRNFFATDDITPLSPSVKCRDAPMNASATASFFVGQNKQEQQEEDHAILVEFADLWESNAFHL
mmetsp:Transcript_17584/g.38070  ORF Transcript_17584/g.38070 Transcript_17584/m.38070 type:complete len:561 (-) Transcript_17584:186-1868(-)|eukprot:CAMPEP_0172555666 /NCGR_PEP_ID=MMETSP1067-20121228/59309_1 /TAXON_ID=265564 ORGANISM="Thalassiosira punctigera, Strain Tpunct2005C2" /NCGR_SAMPLE_ID=MMETSP1067 /ASSEMBLY_ACC=CAM_ASM_000444 /LENGTH=560 /DNA_ID=CAMNT_0013344215 /DNA_START=73 /DNA_END=1755 /DNA_ORIENTATION=+